MRYRLLALGIVCIVGCGGGPAIPEDQVAHSEVKRARRFIEQGEWDRARQCVDDAIALDSTLADAYVLRGQLTASSDPAQARADLRKALECESSPEIRLDLLRLADQLNDTQTVDRLLRELAPATGGGDPAAYFLAARMALEGKSGDRADAIEHLRKVVAAEPTNRQAHGLLFALLRTDDRAAAQPHLLAADVDGLRAVMDGALLDDLLTQPEGYEDLRAIQNLMRGKLTSEPGNVAARLGLAQTYLWLGDYLEAANFLQQGFDQTGDERFAEELSRVYAHWFDAAADDPAITTANRLTFLYQAMEQDPESPELIARLLWVANQQDKRAVALLEYARSLLGESEQVAPPVRMVARLLVGFHAAFNADRLAARAQLRLAFDEDPLSAEVVGALVLNLPDDSGIDVSKTLELANLLADHYPDQWRFRMIRGLVLSQLGEHQLAVRDLEPVIPAAPANPQLHLALSESYEALGKESAARRHRQLADKYSRDRP